jgi:uncharacterized Fe-S cluster protein YjdI
MRKHYSNGKITILWQPKICSHSGKCARGLSSVFKPSEVPWIDLDGASTDDIVAQVKKCPSGALGIVMDSEGSV